MSQLAPWRAHLEKYRKAHPKLSLKEAMQGASKTFRSRGKGTSPRRPPKQKGGSIFDPPGKPPVNPPVYTKQQIKQLVLSNRTMPVKAAQR